MKKWTKRKKISLLWGAKGERYRVYEWWECRGSRLSAVARLSQKKYQEQLVFFLRFSPRPPSLLLKKSSFIKRIFTNQVVGMPGLEPGTLALKGPCSTNWATFPYSINWRDNIQKESFVEFIFIFLVFFLCNTDKKAYILSKYPLWFVLSDFGDSISLQHSFSPS